MAKKSTPTHCLRCEYPMRKNGVTVKEAPGTRQHHGHGICDACARSDKRRKSLGANTLRKLDQNQRGLNTFLAQRHAREQSRERRAKVRMVIR